MTQEELLQSLNGGTKKSSISPVANAAAIVIDKAAQKVSQPVVSAWDWLSKNLMKPVGVIAAETEAAGNLIGAHKTFNPVSTATDILSGKREYSFSKLWDEYGESAGVPKPIGAVIGLATDIAADPLNFLGVGEMTKLGKIAEKVSSLRESGQTIAKGSKLFNEIEKSGYTAEQLSLAGSRLGQVQNKQRALLTAFGKPVISGEKVYDATGKILGKAKDFPAVTKTMDAISGILSTKSGNKELDEMVSTYNNLSSYRKEKVIETAVQIKKDIVKLTPDEIKMIPELIENPAIRDEIKNPTIISTADRLTSLFKEMKGVEKKNDILKSELSEYFPHIKNKDDIVKTMDNFFTAKKYSATLASAKGRKIQGTVNEINETFGKDFFVSDPALAYGQRGVASAKAVTAKEFLTEVGQKFFTTPDKAPVTHIASTNPLFKGLVASPEVVKTVDKYITGIKPEELKPMLKAFDNVQNWWKSQALLSPMYHTRNFAGNLWNNFLGGVSNPIAYKKAMALQFGKNLDDVALVTANGQKYTGTQVLELAKQNGVMGRGQFSGDIAQTLQDEMYTAKEMAKKLEGYNPLSQSNVLFKGNREIGSAVENNSKLAHFIQKLEDGYSAKSAAQSVKKYLFDYADLTDTEKKIFKRIAPFYTWTRKNIPLQIENLFVNPEKWSLVPKVVNAIESGSKDPKTEKYMSYYLKSNIPVKVGQDKNGNYQYFMLGSWLPSAQAIDFLSQPLDNIFSMASPLAKAPLEYWSNKSTFFKNTFGEASNIEYYEKQPTQFMGIEMRKKNANLLRNIRVFSMLDKFLQTPSKDEPENSMMVKVLDTVFGKAATYDVSKAKEYYDKDTETKISELTASYKKAKKDKKPEYAEKIKEEIKRIKKERK